MLERTNTVTRYIDKVPIRDFLWPKIIHCLELVLRPINPAKPSPKAITRMPAVTAEGLFDQNKKINEVMLPPYAIVPKLLRSTFSIDLTNLRR